ncbi:MAG: crotonase/enoyl-CoA hydratase family protein [Aliihoeflea sp.]
MNLDSRFFDVQRHGAVAHLRMARPDKANSMNADFWHDLPRLLSELEADNSVRAAIVSGEGKHFSSGMDLAVFSGIVSLFEEEDGRAALAMRDLILELQASLSSIERVRFPVIAAIHGACLGGAIDLITACDIRLASADARFAVEEISVGMAADVGTLQRLPRLISPSVAAELAYTGRSFSAEEARQYGLLSQVLDSREDMMREAFAVAEAIAARSPLAVTGIKRNLLFSRDHTVAAGLDYVATWNGGMLRTSDVMAAIQAKLARSPGEFQDVLPRKDLGG